MIEKITIEINNQQVTAYKDDTILQAATRVGIRIPTLCYHPALKNAGACRMCVVEVSACERLVASCSYPVSEGMKVQTHSQRVQNARKTILELIIANHPMVCLKCERNGDCELQTLAAEYNITEVRYAGKMRTSVLDDASDSVVRDTEKCIVCGRCIKACGDDIQTVWAIGYEKRGFNIRVSPAFEVPLKDSTCIDCGQCVTVCPTAALKEKSDIDITFQAIYDKNKHTVVQTAPSIRVSIAEALGLQPGLISTGKMVTALKRIGFDKVFDTSLSADLTIMEEASELVHRIQHNAILPLFTSCSPGWVKFVEQFYPEFIPNLSTCKSPQQMLGAVIKSYYAQSQYIAPENIFSAAVMPCTAKKYERNRKFMNRGKAQDIDAVLTTRELAKMITLSGIDFEKLEDSVFDCPLGCSSGAGDIFASSGGVMEASIRTAHYLITGKPLENLNLSFARGIEGVKEGEVDIDGLKIRVAVVNSLGMARKLLEKIGENQAQYDFVEVMACPGGCIGGGGQPRGMDIERLKARMAAVYEIDKNKPIRESYLNPDVQWLYKEFIGEPYGEIAHKYLHTKYSEKFGV